MSKRSLCCLLFVPTLASLVGSTGGCLVGCAREMALISVYAKPPGQPSQAVQSNQSKQSNPDASAVQESSTGGATTPEVSPTSEVPPVGRFSPVQPSDWLEYAAYAAAGTLAVLGVRSWRKRKSRRQG